VEVESFIGKGTTFRVTIPRAEVSQAAAEHSAGAGAWAGGRVLIVDDERPVAEATSLLLEVEGFEVRVASSEQEALDCVRGFSPDVIVSDYHLRGGETGAGVVAAVRDKLGWVVPVVFVTGDTARSGVANARVERAMLLSKPVPVDDLLDTVRDQIAAHGEPQVDPSRQSLRSHAILAKYPASS